SCTNHFNFSQLIILGIVALNFVLTFAAKQLLQHRARGRAQNRKGGVLQPCNHRSLKSYIREF
ncbi:hypothetical protein, partial [Escherichia coli]|uniref:hypothetical protein n=1 Tax=Escherichia coli TaxID=562 RepID=UPI001AD93DD3